MSRVLGLPRQGGQGDCVIRQRDQVTVHCCHELYNVHCYQSLYSFFSNCTLLSVTVQLYISVTVQFYISVTVQFYISVTVQLYISVSVQFFLIC